MARSVKSHIQLCIIWNRH